MDQIQEKIIKHCYNKSISDLAYSIPIIEILDIEPFNQINIRIFIRELKNLNKEGYIKLKGNFPIDNLEFLFIEITLKGLIFWEEKNPNLNPSFSELIIKYLNFVQEVEHERIELNEGLGSQYGSITLTQLSDILEEPSQERILFVQQKSNLNLTQRIGYSSKLGIVFYGENEPFLTIEGANFLIDQENNENKAFTQNMNEFEIQRIDQQTISCKFPGDSDLFTLKHIADFNSILPDFYAVAGMQFDNNKRVWFSKELFGNHIPVVAESTGLYVEENKENYAEVRKLKESLIIKKEKDLTFGDWEIIRILNRGGQGFIFKVKRKGEITNYALKSYRINRNSSRDEQKIKRFQSEVEALKLTRDCPNVIRLIGKDGIKETEQYSDYYFAMELAEMTLNDYVKQLTKYNLKTIFKYFGQILEGFNCIHKKGIIHRDIKPQNILIKDDEIKVSDFGINYGTTESRITRTREVVGPRFFICPESEDGRLANPDIRCDIYSLGKILYYLLSKGKYFTREKFENVEYNLIKIHNDPKFEVFNKFFRKTITFEKEKRFSSIDELKESFENCIEEFENFTEKQIDRNNNVIEECLEQWRIKPLKENDAAFYKLYEIINLNYYRKVNLDKKELIILKKVIKSIHYQMAEHHIFFNPDIVGLLYLMIKTPILKNIISEKFKTLLEKTFKQNKLNQSLIKVIFELGCFGSWLEAIKLSVKDVNLVMFRFLVNEFFEQIRSEDFIENKRTLISELSNLRDDIEKINQNQETEEIIDKIEILRRHLLELN